MYEVTVECNNRKPQSHGNFHYLIRNSASVARPRST